MATAAGSINKYVEQFGDGPSVFLITQYFVYEGGVPNLVQNNAVALRSGTLSWEVRQEMRDGKMREILYMAGSSVAAPLGWSSRVQNYREAMGVFV